MIGRSGARFFQNLVDRLGLRLGHYGQKRLTRLATRELVGFRQQRPLAGQLLHIAHEYVVVAQSLDDLFGGEPLRKRDGMEQNLAREQFLLDLAHADAGLERIFAALQRAVFAVDQCHRREQRRAFDDARALQLIGDRSLVVLALDQHDLIGGQRAGLAFLDDRGGERDQTDDRADQHEGEERTQARQARSARPPRFGRRAQLDRRRRAATENAAPRRFLRSRVLGVA